MCDCDRVMADLFAQPPVQSPAPATRGIATNQWLWDPGETLGVAFSGGSMGLRRKVAEIAELWPINLHFDWSRPWAEAEIRIELFGEGSWSYVGSVARQVAAGKPTMRLGWAQWAFDAGNMEALYAVVLHEFGHAIGLRHEHLHPFNRIKWNLPALRAHYVDQLGWEWSQVERTYLNVLSLSTHDITTYDDESVMHYPVDERFTLDDFSVGYISKLSRGDRGIGQRLYPFDEGELSEVLLPVVFG